MTTLAQSLGATYTRYADDLAFSGDVHFARQVKSFLAAVESIVVDEGYALNGRKTKIMSQSKCQRITGLVVNSHLNISRAAIDQLKATLHNCIKTNPTSQNISGHKDFRAHLDGRVSWVENVASARGARLRAMFNEIGW
jgi:hypothetical protein